MKTRFKIAFICVLTTLLVSCGCSYHLKKIKAKCGYSQDTVYKTVHVEVPKVEKDTIFSFQQKDTVIIREGRLTVKYHYNSHDSTVYVAGKCDPEVKEIKVPVVVNKYKEAFPWKWLLIFGLFFTTVVLVIKKK